MKTKTKILVVLFVLTLGGLTIYKWQNKRNKATITITKIDQTTQEAHFKMSYKDLDFATVVKLGGIRRQVLQGYVFEAVTKGKTIVLSIQDKAGKELARKIVDFSNG